MDITNINSLTSAAYQQNTKGNDGELGQNEFLQLLVAQMRNQDPINPMDGQEFASQLAQFNSVEQLISVNNGLGKLQESQDMMSAGLTNSMAASLTGKHVKALSNELHLASGGTADVQYKLNDTASEVEIIIRNESGSEVRRETLQGIPSGENSWQWDGKNDAGDRMGEGNYQVEVKATNDGSEINSLVYIEGTANNVHFTGDGVLLNINNIKVPIGDVEEVGVEQTKNKELTEETNQSKTMGLPVW